MKETNDYKFTPEDQAFLTKLGRESEARLRENEITYEEWMERFRKIYGKYEDNKDVEPNYLEKMIRDFEQVYVGADNPPEKQRAVEDFLKELRDQE